MNNNLPVAINILTPDFEFIDVSSQTCASIGQPKNQIIGKKCYDILGQYKDDKRKKGSSRICENCASLRALQTGKNTEMIREVGDKSIIHLFAIPLKDSKKNIIGILEIIENISDKVKDPLTGIFNFRFYDDMIEQECHRSQRTGNCSSIILFDLNNFKAINDTYGHFEGDQILKKVAQTINSLIRKSDRICRIGGDEFVIIAPNTNLETSDRLAKRINQKIINKYNKYNLSFSSGVAVTPTDSTNPIMLRKIADARLYKNKETIKLIKV